MSKSTSEDSEDRKSLESTSISSASAETHKELTEDRRSTAYTPERILEYLLDSIVKSGFKMPDEIEGTKALLDRKALSKYLGHKKFRESQELSLLSLRSVRATENIKLIASELSGICQKSTDFSPTSRQAIKMHNISKLYDRTRLSLVRYEEAKREIGAFSTSDVVSTDDTILRSCATSKNVSALFSAINLVVEDHPFKAALNPERTMNKSLRDITAKMAGEPEDYNLLYAGILSSLNPKKYGNLFKEALLSASNEDMDFLRANKELLLPKKAFSVSSRSIFKEVELLRESMAEPEKKAPLISTKKAVEDIVSRERLVKLRAAAIIAGTHEARAHETRAHEDEVKAKESELRMPSPPAEKLPVIRKRPTTAGRKILDPSDPASIALSVKEALSASPPPKHSDHILPKTIKGARSI